NLLINQLSYDLIVTPNKIKNLDTIFFCSVMGITQEQFEQAMNKITKKNGYHRPSVFQMALNEKQNAKLQENIYQFQGFELIERTTRSYPLGIGAHVFGYINEISPARLEDPRYSSYRQGDYVGINGLESVYEEVLRGQRGVEYWVRDVRNRPRDPYKNGTLDTPAIGGKSIELFLDGELQAYGEKLMNGK